MPGARLTASSEYALGDTAQDGTWTRANEAPGLCLYGYQALRQGLSLFVRNASADPAPLHVTFAYAETLTPCLYDGPIPDRTAGHAMLALFFQDARLFTVKAAQEQERLVPAGHEGWLVIPCPDTSALPPYRRDVIGQALLITCTGTAELLVQAPPIELVESVRAAQGPVETGGPYGMPTLAAPPPLEEPCFRAIHGEPVPRFRIEPDCRPGACHHVVDGAIAREMRNATHQWISDPSAGMPQWLELDFGRTVHIAEVRLRFDSGSRTWQENHVVKNRGPAPNLVKVFRLTVPGNDAWLTVFEDPENFRRFRTIALDPGVETDRLRLEILDMWGGPTEPARLFEIQVF